MAAEDDKCCSKKKKKKERKCLIGKILCIIFFDKNYNVFKIISKFVIIIFFFSYTTLLLFSLLVQFLFNDRWRTTLFSKHVCAHRQLLNSSRWGWIRRTDGRLTMTADGGRGGWSFRWGEERGRRRNCENTDRNLIDV